MIDDNQPKGKEEPSPYYYIENGLIVFTSAYLLKRGFCCKSGCRHCPYGSGKKKSRTIRMGE
jgi:Family of unknown function (DUF5522)